MNKKIADYALIGDCETAALVGRDGAIDWLCWPRFDSEACFAALLGNEDNGCWSLRPQGPFTVTRAYRGGSAILETRFKTEAGAVTVTDFMPIRRDESSSLVRIVCGEAGRVAMETRLALRFAYGHLRPWHRRDENGVAFIGGPHAATLRADADVECGHDGCGARFDVSAGECTSFVLHYRRSYSPPAAPPDACEALRQTERFWRDWSSRCTYRGPHRDSVLRSLITLKTLTSRTTGGIVAAPTAALPEKRGGQRNWDYRFCWLRDATFSLLALLHSGYHQEATEWRDWLLRAIAGMPNSVQPIYGVAGEHRLAEWQPGWLAGFRRSAPVRIGNAAYAQFQLDVYGEVLDALHQAREQEIPPSEWSWRLQRELAEQVERQWPEPDAGIWESRHDAEHFTHSRVMAWVAIDRAVRAAEKHRLDWPLARWRALRRRIHAEVCARGYDEKLGAFTRSYETHRPDGANLLIPIVGFLPPDDPRVRSTLSVTERELMQHGFVYRYETEEIEDGMPKGEAAFLACSFWYVDNLVLQGRTDDARRKFEELLALGNDVGLLSEEYDPRNRELLGNFPQALSHLSLVNSAHNLAQEVGPAQARSSRAPHASA